MEMTILQAVLCGIVYWLAVGNLPFVGLWSLQRPLVCGAITGLILGHPVQGAVIGATINLVYLGFMSAGGSMPADMGLAGVLGTAYAIVGGLDTDTALALAVPIGILGTIVWAGRMTFDCFFVHMADKYIEEEKYNKIWIANVLLPQILCFCMTAIPCALAAYFGSSYIQGILAMLSGKVLTVFQIIGGLMPALGIAITLQYIFKGESKVFLFIGFLLAVYSKLPLLTLGIIALLVAVVYVQVTSAVQQAQIMMMKMMRRTIKMENNKKKSLIPKAALIKAWLIWETFPQTCYNYERMMGQVVAHMFSAIIGFLYKDDPSKRKEVMKREIEFFNVHIEFGSCILGMAVALEEQKAMGENIPGEFITNLKTSLMGPLAGMGDTIWQGVVIPILLAVCIDLTRSGSGNVWGAVIYAVVIVVAAYALSYWNFMFGYKAGSEAIMDFLEKGILNKLIKGASIMGCMVMGGLIVNYVKAACGLKIVSSTTTYSIQTNFLDQVCPSILPLAVTLLVYYLMNKKRWSSLKIIGLIVVIGIVGGITGILAY